MACHQVLDGVLSWLSGGECGEVLHVGGPEDLYLKGPEMACAVLQDLLQVIGRLFPNIDKIHIYISIYSQIYVYTCITYISYIIYISIYVCALCLVWLLCCQACHEGANSEELRRAAETLLTQGNDRERRFICIFRYTLFIQGKTEIRYFIQQSY